jgi:hypothetical protein
METEEGLVNLKGKWVDDCEKLSEALVHWKRWRGRQARWDFLY